MFLNKARPNRQSDDSAVSTQKKKKKDNVQTPALQGIKTVT